MLICLYTHYLYYDGKPYGEMLKSLRSLICVEGHGSISQSGLTQDIEMGSCVFQCEVPYQ